jgi:hypothetical protein
LAIRLWRVVLLSTTVSALLAGCKGVEVSAASSTSENHRAASAPPQSSPVNIQPLISGSPAIRVAAGTAYVFQPTAMDSDGDRLNFFASGLPAWVTLDAEAGTIYGTPSEADVGTTADIVIGVSDGRTVVSLPAFRITVTSSASSPVLPTPTQPPSLAPPSLGNNAPTISGTPPTGVVAGNVYSFAPAANDADGDTLGFSISGKPSWATFSGASGTLTGTPTTAQLGTYTNIVISVSDGTAVRALPAFSITVAQSAPAGVATLSWSAPTQNTDGSPATDLAGYRIYHGTSVDELNDVAEVTGATNTSYTASQLASGTHYFAVTAYNAAGVESTLSTIGAKTIH